MKSFQFILKVVSCVIILGACSKDDSIIPNVSSADHTVEIAQSGSREITCFYDTDKDETVDFSGFNFSFNADRSLVATKFATEVNGSWSVNDIKYASLMSFHHVHDCDPTL